MKKTTTLVALYLFVTIGTMQLFAQDMMMEGVSLFATLNPIGKDNDAVISVSSDLSATTPLSAELSLLSTSIESVDFSADGTAYVTFDAANSKGGIAILSGLTGMNDTAATAVRPSVLGFNTLLAAPKGIDVIESLNVMVVSNFGGKNILVFGTNATGNVSPMGVLSLGEAGSVWDTTYDAASDTLFAAGTAGDILVYEGFSANMSMGPTRTITPANANGEKVSVNLHGLVYLADSDKLILSDVGAVDSNTDGHLWVIENASSAEGNTAVALHITGTASMLGNPVDIAWDGSGLYVAEKANDMILYFANLLDNTGMMDSTPTSMIAATKVESLAFYGADMMMGMGDTDMAMGSSLVFTANPGDITGDAIVGLDGSLMNATNTVNGFSGIASIESVAFDAAGNGYVTVGVSDTAGGLVVIEGLATESSMSIGDISSMVTGPDTGLVAPMGVEVIDSLNLVLVANFGAGNIRGFALDNTNSLPQVSINDFGGVEGKIWDMHYDEATDTLFAAGTTGTLFVYSKFSSDFGNSGPSRFIIPTDAMGNKISVNLHGVDYDAATDTLFLSDVGSADSNSDGQIFVITQSSLALDETAVSAVIGGASTQLGNPVDIEFDNGSLYVAEKANDLILRYDNILDAMGSMDMAGTVVATQTKPESIVIMASGQ